LLQVAGTIRNCCFEADTQLQNLLSLAEYLWPALLLPVAGKKVHIVNISASHQYPLLALDMIFCALLSLLSCLGNIHFLLIDNLCALMTFLRPWLV
jgi:hypothetical protein